MASRQRARQPAHARGGAVYRRRGARVPPAPQVQDAGMTPNKHE